MRIFFTLCVLLFFTGILQGCTTTPAVTQNRVALVIENRDYPYERCKKSEKTKNKVCYSDLKSYSVDGPTESLRKLGFTVLKLNDAIDEQIGVFKSLKDGTTEKIGAIQKFKDKLLSPDGGKLQPNTIGLVYFYGHGFEKEGNNYLVPTNYLQNDKPGISANEWYERLSEGEAEGLLKGSANIFILNVCRTLGQKEVEKNPSRLPARTLVAFATEPGQVAKSTGPYTKTLLKYLSQPNLSIRDLFDKVNDEVRQLEANEAENEKHRPTVIHGDDPEGLFRHTYFAGEGFEGAIDKW
ncbi:MAG: hypothetical protein BWK78_01845 [Thiotrichaceae bacterium IS1]|nr:MAG: hypothetical protein BWK78_01845 [Thiotrichaceae bacterium IS1]